MKQENTTLKSWLTGSTEKLNKTGVKSSRLDCLLLLEKVLCINRASLLAHLDDPLNKKQLTKLNELLDSRLNRQPIAYLLGHKEFYNRQFVLNSDVLIPRPESESFIELLKKHGLSTGNLLDIGTGSGILGISAKLEHPNLNVTLSDISAEALKVARNNAEQLNAEVSFKQTNLLDTTNSYGIILANLPYVPSDMKVEKELDYEPRTALFVDGDGLDLYRGLANQISGLNTSSPKIAKPTFILTESLLSQHAELNKIMEEIGYSLMGSDHLVQLFRQRTAT